MKKLSYSVMAFTDRSGLTPKKGIIIVLMIPKTNVKRVAVILNMRKIVRIGDFMERAKLIRKQMKGNANFPTPPVSVADGGAFDLDIQALMTAETNAKTKAKGMAALRDAAKQTVLNDMHLLQGYVQTIADANPAKSETIVSGSGFDMKIAMPKSKNDFSGRGTKLSGTVKLEVNVTKATGGSRRSCFKWQMSTDGNIFTDLPTTLRGSTTVSGLTAGTYMWFRYMVVLKDGESSWSQPEKVLVQ